MALPPTLKVLEEIEAERASQNLEWGEQNHPDVKAGEDAEYRKQRMAYAKLRCNEESMAGALTWHRIMKEELAEAVYAATIGDEKNLREELIQVAAVAVAWIEAIDRRSKRVENRHMYGSGTLGLCFHCNRPESDPIHTMSEPLK